MARYVSNKNETVRMFESDFMEFFSHVHPVDAVGDLPSCDWLHASRCGHPAGVADWDGRGFVCPWHPHLDLGRIHDAQLCFPLPTQKRLGKHLHFVVHGVHHDYPNDASRLVVPPTVSLPLALIFYGLFLAIFGHLAPTPFAGLLFGYLCYDMIHYATHHFSMKRGVWLWLKQYHMRHHYKDDHNGYGVSSPLWDYVFRTRTTEDDITAAGQNRENSIAATK